MLPLWHEARRGVLVGGSSHGIVGAHHPHYDGSLMGRGGEYHRRFVRLDAATISLAVVLVLVAIILVMAPAITLTMGPTPNPRERAFGGSDWPDWESKKCMRDTEKVEPYAFAVCYERKGSGL